MSCCPASTRPPALPWVLARMPAGYRAIVADNGSTDGSAGDRRARSAPWSSRAARAGSAPPRTPGPGGRRPTGSCASWTPTAPSTRAQLPRVADPVAERRGRPGARPAPPDRPRRLAAARPARQRACCARRLRRTTGLAGARPRPDARRPPRRRCSPWTCATGGSATRWRWCSRAAGPAGASPRSTSTTRPRAAGTGRR